MAYTRDRELGRRVQNQIDTFEKLSLDLEIQDLVKEVSDSDLTHLTVETVGSYIDKIHKSFEIIKEISKLEICVEHIIVPILLEKKFEKLHENALKVLVRVAGVNPDMLKPHLQNFPDMFGIVQTREEYLLENIIFKVTGYEPMGDLSTNVRRVLAIGFASGYTREDMLREIMNLSSV